jgi:hypothetical protein
MTKKSTEGAEYKLAEWLAGMRLAKYRHDNNMEPLENGHEWFNSVLIMAEKNGTPNMFEPTTKQLIELAESCGTICSPQYNNEGDT